MRLQDVISSKPVTQAGLSLARVLPPRVGYTLTHSVAWLIAKRKPQLYFTVQENLRQVLGSAPGQETLGALTHQLFRHAGMTYYDFFHAVGQSPNRLAQLMPVPQDVLDQIQTIRVSGRGVLLLGMHLSNFDLALLSFGAHGLPIQALSLANPHAGFQILNQLRAEAGFEITPISPTSLRRAIHRLKTGGIVMTGMDRPDPQDRALVPMFGREAFLPLGPARLALLTKASVFLGACHYTPGLGYAIVVEGPLELSLSGNRQADIYANTCRFAAFMETQIETYPEQWMMFHPFWPQDEESK